MLHSFNSVYPLAESLYGVTAKESDYEDVALDGYERIGNKHTRLYRYVGDVVNGKLELPCNVAEGVIESVHIPIPDTQRTSNISDWNSLSSLWTESFIDFKKIDEDPYWTRGKYVKYDEGNDVLYFSHDYKRVMVVYHGILMDDDQLPLLNDKEIKAIAAYVAYMSLFKEGLQKRDGNIIKIAQVVKEDWLRLCNAARIPEHLSQNDMDRILDVKVRYDRKHYGKSLKPIL